RELPLRHGGRDRCADARDGGHLRGAVDARAARGVPMNALRYRWGWLALAIAVVALVLFPVYWMVVTSLLPSSVVLSRNPPLVPPLEHVSSAAFAEVFARRPVFTWIWNSTIVVVGSTAISL